MGGQRNNLTELRKIIPDPYQQAVGLVPTVSTYVDERGLTQYIYTLQPVAPGSAQTKIQFQYNGGNLGTAGTVDHFNVVSASATFTRAGDTVTLTIPAGAAGANPTASVGLSAVNGVAATFMRSDAAPALSQAIVPTWSGVHTFTPQAVFTGGLTTDGGVTILTDVLAGSGNVQAGSLGHIRSIGGWTTYSSVDQFYVGFTGDADPPALGRVFVSKGDNTGAKLDALQLEIGTANTSIMKALNLDGVISPSALSSGNNNNYNPTGLSTASLIRITPDSGGSTLTGITAPSTGGAATNARLLYLLNLGTGVLTLSNQSVGSTAANRLILGATSITMNSGQGIGLWYDLTTSRWRVLDTISSSSAQAPIQIQDSGVNQGSAGDATTYNFTGGISAVVSAGVATLDVSGYPDVANLCGGTGETGNVDLDGTNTFSFLSKSGNDYTVNATTNLAIARLRITTGCTLSFAGGKASIQQWVCTSGFYGKIVMDGGNGTNAVGSAAGTAGGAKVTATDYFAAGTAGSNGSASTTTNSASTGSSTGSSQAYGGAGTRGGQGGNGSPGNAGTTGTAGTASGYQPMGGQFQLLRTNSGAAWTAGFGGSGGTGGGGDNTNAGGGGGGGGGGGSGLDISVGEIVTDASTPGGLLTSNGGNGGNGAAATLGNTGGGGGGGAGGGGAIRLVLGKRTGPAVVGFMTANGGKGGNAGALHGTGQNGVATSGGSNGRLFLYNGAATTWAVVATVSAGSAASGLTGGAGATASVDL